MSLWFSLLCFILIPSLAPTSTAQPLLHYLPCSGTDVTFDIIKDAGVTGNFEVTLVETGELIHSKKSGKGKCESNTERAAVCEKIQALLDSA